MCSKKCHQEFYAPVVATQLDSVSEIIFRLNMANGPQITSSYKPKTSLSQYMVDVLSVLSVWFGFSFLEVIRRVGIFFQKWLVIDGSYQFKLTNSIHSIKLTQQLMIHFSAMCRKKSIAIMYNFLLCNVMS